MKLILKILGLAVLIASQVSARDPVSVGRGYEALASNEADRLIRIAQYEKTLRAYGVSMSRGYQALEEGQSESQVTQNFEYIPFKTSQKICGENYAGPVICRVRTYNGMTGNQKVNVTITFRKDQYGSWSVIAWE